MKHARDTAPIDSSKALLGVGVVGLAGWLFYEFVWKEKKAQGATPPSGPIQPGPGPGNLPAPTGAIGDSAVQGDTILVSTKGVPGLPSNVASEIEMTVVGASPNLPMVIAQATGREGDGVPQGFGSPVPRSAITMVSHTGPAPGGDVPIPPIPSLPGLPGGIPGLPPPDLGSPMNLQTGHHYRARLQLGGLEAAMANADLVKNVFAGQGFSDVKVYHSGVDTLPADWPLATKVAEDSSVWYAEGTWSGPSGPVPRPPQVALAWEQ